MGLLPHMGGEHHLERLTQARTSLGLRGHRHGLLWHWELGNDLSRAWNTSHIHGGVVVKVIVGCDQSIASRILETDTIAIVDAIEVFNRSNDGLCGIMGVDDDSQGNARPGLGSFVEQELKGY